MDLAFKIIAVTSTAVLLYLILKNPDGFNTAVSSGSSAYVDAVKALQGR